MSQASSRAVLLAAVLCAAFAATTALAGEPPGSEGWTFYGRDQGGPREVFGVTADEGGNIWVAGGEEGLFLLERGATKFRRFTMEDGLHPYGYPRPELGTITRKYLKVISVAGGPAGTAFVGYAGMPVSKGTFDCENNWDRPGRDPNIYKSGDADRVMLDGDGIRVVHYDISTEGREKLCRVYRILYDRATRSVWFATNHGLAWGDPDYPGNPTCYGHESCSGVREHAHPVLQGYGNETMAKPWHLTGEFFGLAMTKEGDVWFGGQYRSMRCAGGFAGSGLHPCDKIGYDKPAYHVDWWPDEVHHFPRPSQRTDDFVSGMSVSADGTLWIGSFVNGLARRSPDGTVSYISEGLVDPRHVTAVKVDPLDDSVWVGAQYGGLTRIKDGRFLRYDFRVFGKAEENPSLQLIAGAIPDIQVDSSGKTRRMLVAFHYGAIGIYDGP